MNKMFGIDGGVLEGGGQILRNVASLACLFRIPVKISNIRAGRDKPGLRPQHLSGLQLVCQLCHGRLEGGRVGSTLVELFPGDAIIPTDSMRIDMKTAGSISLLLQTSIPCLAFASGNARIELIGGTDADHAPPIDFMSNVFKPYAEKFGLKFDIELAQRGFYPRGGGKIVLSTTPIKNLNAVELLKQGRITRIYGRSWVAGNLNPRMAGACKSAAIHILKKHPLLSSAEIDIEAVHESPKMAPMGNANAIELYAVTNTGCILSSSLLGRKDYSPEQMGEDAADKLIANIKNGECVDEYIQDQVVILMALAEGHSKIRTGPPTLHTQTAILMAETMTESAVKFSHKPDDDLGGYILEATGIGFKNIHV